MSSYKQRKKRNRKKNKDSNESHYLLELLSWIPELLILPFRLFVWLIRSIGRLFD
ncbi:hypothetical protein GGQ92_001253 [Gracilibacillus halotolerans]|uniref:Uncharacterized protein n=1 Tax=Gracilibacillus halotolerans TaxID=74386 RepID=A0A841REL9_9BACI|nr:hypothetical protein [Gracilibacillus halotolerans]MBB6512470.1 hypothetical protein [Gracilibacillus halotolerans]